ncbi:hypothetical protein [Pseudomonas sp. C5pp]|uniref:hypothetical protein n=1 Tax=Pseudomonas sp. C5pp TaxID=1586081 RepID=UPI00057E567A|nr:hypothetical protein [Pseudomonas sp. C5pp]KIC83522.1 hypothetical protein RR51_06190 [Pseudomonas sp. C5pp]
MQITLQGGEDLEQALREIHRRACTYEGPLVHQFMELAKLSAPVEPDEPLGEEPQRNRTSSGYAESARRSETKERFEEALSLLMVLAFPVNSGTEQAVRRELNELLARDQQVESMHMRVGNRKTNLRHNLGRRPTKQQIALREALLKFLPRETKEDL